jgi:hypothetical protein
MKPAFIIADGERLFRHAVHPVSFKKGVFDQRGFWHLVESSGMIIGSLAWQQFVPTNHYVHEYGCRLASRRNDDSLQQGRYRETKRQVYCGAYQLSAGAIRKISWDELTGVFSADVVHQVEMGEIAHTEFRFHLKPESDVETTKTAIFDRLWNSCSGPLDHVCACDKQISPHPGSNLLQPPLGKYRETRSPRTISWHVKRFKILRWLWLMLKRCETNYS